MRISTSSSVCSILLVIVCGLPLARISRVAQAPAPSRAAALSSLQLPFVENRGQVDPRVAYYAPTFAGTAFVTRDGALVLTLGQAGSLVEQPVGTPGRPQGVEPAPTRVNIVTDRVHEEALPTFGAVAVPSPWAGVALSYRAHGNNIERIFSVAPGADAGAIRMQVRGAQALSERAGTLVARTHAGEVILTAPIAYQAVGGERRPVSVRYHIQGDEYGFVLGPHDPRSAVVIDPLLQATYLQSRPDQVPVTLTTGPDNLYQVSDSLAIGGGGDLYAAGFVRSAVFPGIDGGFITPTTNEGGFFVARISADLKSLKQVIYYGVAGMQVSSSTVARIAVDPSNSGVYLLGNFACSSPCAALPDVAGGAMSSGDDAFLVEFNSSLTSIVQATYVGGSSSDTVTDMQVAPSGSIYVAGTTTSNDIAATTGGAQPTHTPGISNFITEFQANLTTIVQSTYLGDDDGNPRLAVSSSGDVYVSGTTSSASFPDVTGGAQSALSGTTDEFVTHLTGDLTTIVQSTYLGEGAEQAVVDLLVGSSGDVYAVADSEDADFNATSGGAQTRNSSSDETCVVTQLRGDLTAVRRSTFVGGTSSGTCLAAALDSSDDVYVTGVVIADPFDVTQTMTAMTGGVEPEFYAPSSIGGYVLKISPDLTQFQQGTYFSGTGGGLTNSLVMGNDNDLYVGGVGIAYGTAGGLQATSTTSDDPQAYLGHFSDDLLADAVLLKTDVSFDTSTGVSLDATLDIKNESAAQPATGLELTFDLGGGVQLSNDFDTSGLKCDGTQGTVHCRVTGQLVDSTLNTDPILLPGQTLTTTVSFTSRNTSGTGTVSISADQDLAAGSTKSLKISAQAAGGSGGGGSGDSSGGGGGNFGLLLILGLAGLVARRRR